MSDSANNDIWIAIISSAGTLLTALGIGKVVPAIIKWIDEKKEERRKNKAASLGEVESLRDRIDKLELELDHSRKFQTRTESTINAMIPLMKEMMKEHPHYVALLIQLENNIMGNEQTTSAQGENDD